LKRSITIIILYVLGVLFGYLSTWFFNGSYAAIEIFKAPQLWLAPLIFIVLGLAIGGLLLILNKPENRKGLLFYATFTALLLFCITFASFQFHDWYHARYLANIEANADFLNGNASYPRQEIQAFKTLTDKYKDPNDLRLFETSVSRYDSIIDRAKTDVYDVGFVYFKKHKKGSYRSQCKIIGDRGYLQYFDLRLTNAEEHRADSSNNEGLREGLKAILDDSLKLSLDSATKATIRNKIKSKKIVLDTLYR
jgi:hypothetical protein